MTSTQGTPARFLQANLHHAVAATAIVEKCLVEGKVDLALLQEPWVANGNIQGLNSGGKLVSNTNGKRPRACIVITKSTNFLPVPELCTDDLVAAYVDLRGWEGRRIIVCSAYLPGEKTNPAVDLFPVVEYARKHNAELIVGCDANAHHDSWGSSDTNERGEFLYDFLLANCFELLNVGTTPTFVTRARQEVLDITFCTPNLARKIMSWEVSTEASLSDHRHIRFELSVNSTTETVTFRDPKCTSWVDYNQHLEDHLMAVPKSIKTPNCLDVAVTVVTEGIVQAFEDSCPLRIRTMKRKVPWWNSKLKKLRDKTRKLFNRAKKTKEWYIYRKALTEYSKEIRRAKRASWRRFCEEINSLPQGARLHKLLAKSAPNQLGLLKRSDESFTSDETETLELLAKTHFPGALHKSAVNSMESPPHRPHPEDWRRAAIVFRPGAVRWAIGSFAPNKSSGADKISPLLLQKGVDLLAPLLVKIFRASYAWGYIPEMWTKVKVIFIPKAGKKDYASPKAFRPISLSSFLLKTMEKVLDRYIRDELLIERPIHSTQHAYCRGRSTETALLSLVDKVEKALEDKEIALVAFLDIEGAFDNTPTRTLVSGLASKLADMTTIRWVKSMLSNRIAILQLNKTSHEVLTTRGCPQGGVLSPLLWTLAVDELLYRMAGLRIDTLGYADDLVITVRGSCQSALSNLMQVALHTIEKWCRENELTVNAEKTVIVPFTRRRNLDRLESPTVNGKSIPFSVEVKYLGITLDQKLTWNSHVNGVLRKAKSAIGICGRLAGARWGLNPKMTLWLYTAIVRPSISYASVVWCGKMAQVTTQNKLSSLQRTACLLITGAMNTSPGAALEAMLNLPPLFLYLRKEARMTMYRLTSQCRKKWLSQALRDLQDSVTEIPVLGMPSDSMPPTYNFRKSFMVEIPEREDWIKERITWRPGSLIWYTDGSKSGKNVGCGVFGEKPREKLSMNLGAYTSIFQAEVYAILLCAETILQKGHVSKTIYINSDSQAALSALSSVIVNSRLVEGCRDVLNTLAQTNRVVLRWVPGHAGISGNEYADILAKAGARMQRMGPEPVCGIPRSLARLTLLTYCYCDTLIRWRNLPGMRHSKALVQSFNKKAASEALALSRNNLRILARALTGHCGLNRHMFNLRLQGTDVCRLCQEHEETPLHIICECPALMHARSVHLGKHILQHEEAHLIPAKKLLLYLAATNIGEDI